MLGRTFAEKEVTGAQLAGLGHKELETLGVHRPHVRDTFLSAHSAELAGNEQSGLLSPTPPLLSRSSTLSTNSSSPSATKTGDVSRTVSPGRQSVLTQPGSIQDSGGGKLPELPPATFVPNTFVPTYGAASILYSDFKPARESGMRKVPRCSVPMRHSHSRGPRLDVYGRNLIVNYLPTSWDHNNLKVLFQPFGPVESTKVVTDPRTGESKTYGFVLYSDEASAQKAIESLNGHTVTARDTKGEKVVKRIKVALARPATKEYQDANLFVSGLPRWYTEKELRPLFEQWCNEGNELVECRIIQKKAKRRIRSGAAFVRFHTRDEATLALEKMNGFTNTQITAPLAVKRACRTRTNAREGRFGHASSPRPDPQKQYLQNRAPFGHPHIQHGGNPYAMHPAIQPGMPMNQSAADAVGPNGINPAMGLMDPYGGNGIWDGRQSPGPVGMFTIPGCNPQMNNMQGQADDGVPGEARACDLDAVLSMTKDLGLEMRRSPSPLMMNNLAPIMPGQIMSTFQFPPILQSNSQCWSSHNANLLESAQMVGTPIEQGTQDFSQMFNIYPPGPVSANLAAFDSAIQQNFWPSTFNAMQPEIMGHAYEA